MYDQPGARVPVINTTGAAIKHGTPVFLGGHVGFLEKNQQISRWVKPGTEEADHVMPNEQGLLFVVGVHELPLTGSVSQVGVGDKVWIDAQTQALLTSVGGGTGGSPANEVQKLTVKATGGFIKITLEGVTVKVKFNASHAEVQEAFEATNAFDPGDVVVTGGPGDEGGTTPYVFTYGGQYADTDVPTLVKDDTELTGGEHKSEVATTTAGAGSSDTSLPLGIIDSIDTSRSPHVGRINLDDLKPFIAG